MNKLALAKRALVVRCLVDGASLRATVRITGVARMTVMKLLSDLGHACSLYQDMVFRKLPCKRLQCDEIWSFVYAKDKNVPTRLRNKKGVGSVWTWTALCADFKLIPCWYVGTRDAGAAYHFIHDLAARLAARVQLTTNGHKAYVNAVEDAFGANIDYAMLQKVYGNEPAPEEARYSPAKCMGTRKTVISGKPDHKHVSTSYAERANLTIRMNNRRFTRLTNGFSKKVENHEHHLALHFMYYNFARIHQSLRIAPAMAAGVTDHLWNIENIISLLDDPRFQKKEEV
jgi:IS1 family transposase